MVSSTIELVPVQHVLEVAVTACRRTNTEFDNDGKMPLHFERLPPLHWYVNRGKR